MILSPSAKPLEKAPPANFEGLRQVGDGRQAGERKRRLDHGGSGLAKWRGLTSAIESCVRSYPLSHISQTVAHDPGQPGGEGTDETDRNIERLRAAARFYRRADLWSPWKFVCKPANGQYTFSAAARHEAAAVCSPRRGRRRLSRAAPAGRDLKTVEERRAACLDRLGSASCHWYQFSFLRFGRPGSMKPFAAL